MPHSDVRWRAACDTVHTMPGGGTDAMWAEVHDLGGRVADLTYTGASRHQRARDLRSPSAGRSWPR